VATCEFLDQIFCCLILSTHLDSLAISYEVGVHSASTELYDVALERSENVKSMQRLSCAVDMV
jgi:hypothetical protein